MSYLSMYRGDDRTLTITASEALDGSMVRFTARRTQRSSVAAIEKSTPDGIDVDGATATVTLEAADTNDLEPRVYWWDVEVTDGENEVHTVAAGRLSIKPDITRPSEGS